MQIIIRTSQFVHRWVCLVFLLVLVGACTQKSFSIQEKSSNSQAVNGEPDTKASDRPTESGTGVPGYLVGCSPVNVQDDNVQIACNTTTADGTRVNGGQDVWNRYDIRLPTDAPIGVTISKSIAPDLSMWDVYFNFHGADKAVLSKVARNSTYAVSYPDANGQPVRIETAPLPPQQEVAAPSANTQATCVGGVIVDGVCFVPVESSCADYCSKAGLAPHPYVVNRFGNGPGINTDANKQNCRDLFFQIKVQQTFRFEDTRARGWGCYEESSGRVLFDSSETDPFEFPRIGDRRICGCQ